MVVFIMSNLLVHVVLVVQVCTKLLPRPSGKTAPEIYLFELPAAKIFPDGRGIKKIPREKSKNSGDFMEVVTF